MQQHEANQAFWDASTPWWKEREDERGLWRRAHKNPSLVLTPLEMSFLEHIEGKRACVLGSGDNEVAFALAGLGAEVTSVDISLNRLRVAAGRARSLGLELSFTRADVTNLCTLRDSSFDLTYTGGHMSVWVADIGKYYAEAVRILKRDGLFLMNDYHPIRRVWEDSEGSEPRHSYFDRGPYEYTSTEGLPTFEYHWTVADHVQAVIDAGCRIVEIQEHGEGAADEFWMKPNLDKLPGYLTIIGTKRKDG